jgi:hypothetical protein
MDQEDLKTCRYCREQIKVAAKVCPHCRQWLSPFSLRNTSVFVALAFLWSFVNMFVLVALFNRMFNPGTDFAPYRNQICVIDSHMTLETNQGDGPFVYIVAVATNQTDMEWKEIEFDARFYNKEGELIDVGEGEFYDTLYPKMDAAFRIRAKALHPLPDYDSYKIYVGSARDAHARF